MVMRNPSYVTKNIRSQWSVRKNLLAYRALHDRSEYSGGKRNLEVHHIIPVSMRPDLAGAHSNMVVLTRGEHLHMAHAGSFTVYVPNIRALIDSARIQRTIGYGSS